MLYASLAISLFSAFLATLGKQWLNVYASTDMRGTAIERSQNRQRKLNGIVTWRFENVMESLPLMLHIALLLLGCALSRYLWEIDTTTAAVVISVTSFGILFYLFILVAGTASKSCPYQTPGSHGLRSVASAFASVHRQIIQHSKTAHMLQVKGWSSEPWWPSNNVIVSLGRVPCKLLGALAADILHLGQGMVQLPVAFTCQMYTWLFRIPSAPGYRPDQKTTSLDLQCISWVLKTSLDKAVHLSALEYLATTVTLVGLDPTLIMDCFNILVSCTKFTNNIMVTQGSEQLATVSATCILHILSHLLVIDPTSGILGDIRQQYGMVFLHDTTFKGLPFCHTLSVIHKMFHPDQNYPQLDWEDYRPSNHGYDIFAHALAKLAFYECQRGGCSRVPSWILQFGLHCLSLDLLPSISVIFDCLSIIAIDLGCNVINTGTSTPEERYVYIQQISISSDTNFSNPGLVYK